MGDSSNSQEPYILYHDYYSICSLQVRYTFALRGPPKDNVSQMEMEELELDLTTKGHLKEEYLCEINPAGQVPVLMNPSLLPTPLPESLDISYYICDRYPSLLPAAHKDEIAKLLHDLHDINFFSLSFEKGPPIAHGNRAAVMALLAKPGISPRYEKALKHKLEIIQTHKIDGLIPETVKDQVKKAHAWLSEIDAILSKRPADTESVWLYAGDAPTVLDAHLAVFIARLRDVRREKLIPEGVNRYGDVVMATAEWRELMGGRGTMMPKPKGM